MTALMKACNEGHIDIVRLLLDRGAHLDTQDEKVSSHDVYEYSIV